jgi:hypothetical protein
MPAARSRWHRRAAPARRSLVLGDMTTQGVIPLYAPRDLLVRSAGAWNIDSQLSFALAFAPLPSALLASTHSLQAAPRALFLVLFYASFAFAVPVPDTGGCHSFSCLHLELIALAVSFSRDPTIKADELVTLTMMLAPAALSTALFVAPPATSPVAALLEHGSRALRARTEDAERAPRVHILHPVCAFRRSPAQ